MYSQQTNKTNNYIRNLFQCDNCCISLPREGIVISKDGDHTEYLCHRCFSDFTWETYQRTKAQARYQKSVYPKVKWYQRLFKKNRVYLTASTWERDLTRENVESNPGPASETPFQDKLDAFTCMLEDGFQSIVDKCTIDSIEDTLMLIHDVFSAHNRRQVISAIIHYIKHRTKKNFFFEKAKTNIVRYYDYLFLEDVQSFEDDIKLIRKYIKDVGDVPNMEAFKKLKKFLLYVLSMNVFNDWGLSHKSMGYSRMEEEALRRTHSNKFGFFYCTLDLIGFLCEKGYQCYKLGTVEPIYHSSEEYSKWYSKSQELLEKSNHLGNPAVIQLDVPHYIGEVEDCITKGRSILKFKDNFEKHEITMVSKTVSSLSLIRDEQLCRDFACKDRPFPFGVLIYGTPGVCKSAFRQILFTHYGKLHGKDTRKHFMYTRDGFNQFWTHFRSDQWCITFDDIGFFHDNKTPNGDPTLIELLAVGNSTVFCPPQASLEDKGKTPVRAELLIATSNVEHMNASYNFTCPLAARRRLPFVVELTVKPEFAKPGGMANLAEIPEYPEGEYMDIWQINLKEIVPSGNKGQAVTRLIHTFDNIYKFLHWYHIATTKHVNNQKKAMTFSEQTENIKLCPDCHSVSAKCICDEHCFKCQETTRDCICFEQQNSEVVEHKFMQEFAEMREDNVISKDYIPFMSYLRFFIFYFAYHDFFLCRWLGTCFLYSGWFDLTTTLMCDSYIRKRVFKHMSHKFQSKLGQLHLTKIALCISTLLASAYIYKKFFSKDEGEIQGSAQSVVVSTDIGEEPVIIEKEPENVWFNDSYNLSEFDTGTLTQSWKQFDFPQIIRKITPNIVALEIKREFGDVIKTRYARGICLKGNLYMFNNHCLPDDKDKLQVEFVHSLSNEGVNPNKSMILCQKQIIRMPQKDLCFIEIHGVIPKKDITQLFMSRPAGKFAGKMLTRELNGTITERNSVNLRAITQAINTEDVKINMPLWFSTVDIDTTVGDCGSVVIAEGELGPIILGIHVVRYKKSVKPIVGALSVTSGDIEEALAMFSPQIQSGEPVLSAPSVDRVVSALHPKSVVRFIQDGTADVYGSFLGFKPSPRTRVVDSIISESLFAEGYKKTHTHPEMKGWRPWRLAALEMTDPNHDFEVPRLVECADAFFNDIKKGLSESDLKEVMIYDDFTTVNGYAGLKYVDKINRNTSAGFPWKKGKKYFNMNVESRESAPDPVMPNSEIMDRCNDIIAKYKRGERYCPVFTASLKDEPVSFKKAEAGNTRVFAAAPYDWIIVVRKYYLALTRVMQKNKFLFEAAPGTVCQGPEWGQIYTYLTRHGDNQIVAGDYKKYDKRMCPDIMMQAFRILMQIAELAGFSEEDLLIMKGIAVDTCYPVMDFNGELIQFYGSNPSGQPLTVHINCIVNSLYMRYTYSLLVSKPLSDFKRYVSLMTYGDDNAMGISPVISSKFNHTSISNALASVDVVYTMADKDSESVPLINIKDISFLKRTWRWDDDVEAFMCPLEHDSIQKMLVTGVVKKGTTPEHHAVDVIASALREYFFYGKETFHKKRAMFQKIIAQNHLESYIDDYTLPTWIELCNTYFPKEKQ